MARLAGCIERGLTEVQAEQQNLRTHVRDLQAVADTLAPERGTGAQRQQQFETLRQQFAGSAAALHRQLAQVMSSFQAGLFVGGGEADLAPDNLALERWFRLPKAHERHIHGHRHAGVRIVQEGPTLALALDAHLQHPEPYTPADLAPLCPRHRAALATPSHRAPQDDAPGAFEKTTPLLLAELEARSLDSS